MLYLEFNDMIKEKARWDHTRMLYAISKKSSNHHPNKTATVTASHLTNHQVPFCCSCVHIFINVYAHI